MKPVSIVIAALLAISGLMAQSAYADPGVPPVLDVKWTPSNVAPGGFTNLTFTLGNLGTVAALTGVAFDFPFPAGLNFPNVAPMNIACGTVSVAGNVFHYTGGTIPANRPIIASPCNVSMMFTPAAAGIYTSTSTAVASIEGGAAAPVSATLTVGSAPSISTVFNPAAAATGQSVSLTYTMTNPNAADAVTGLGFNNALPAGLVVATPNGVTNTCAGGTVTAVPGASTVQLSGGSLAASGSCTVTVNLVSNAVGIKNNAVQVTSTNLGNGNTANSSLTVTAAPPTTAVPTLSDTAMLVLASLLVIAAAIAQRRQSA